MCIRDSRRVRRFVRWRLGAADDDQLLRQRHCHRQHRQRLWGRLSGNADKPSCLPAAHRGEKMSKKTLYLECYSGISGDMVTAALLDLGADEAVLRKALASLPLDGFSIKISRVKKSGLDACDFEDVYKRQSGRTGRQRIACPTWAGPAGGNSRGFPAWSAPHGAGGW